VVLSVTDHGKTDSLLHSLTRGWSRESGGQMLHDLEVALIDYDFQLHRFEESKLRLKELLISEKLDMCLMLDSAKVDEVIKIAKESVKKTNPKNKFTYP